MLFIVSDIYKDTSSSSELSQTLSGLVLPSGVSMLPKTPSPPEVRVTATRKGIKRVHLPAGTKHL